MKGKKAEMERVKRILENDRVVSGDSFKELLVCDLNKLLSDYFEFRSPPEPVLTKCGDKVKVEITLFATRIKTFGFLPQEN